jgi:hypothetical protein
MSERPLGKRYSHVYLSPEGEPVRDSERMRRRLAFFFTKEIVRTGDLVGLVRTELGIDVPMGPERALWGKYFETVELRDLLDTITLVWHVAGSAAMRWLEFVERVFREEHTAFTVDACGGVHIHVDAEFQRNRVATVAQLAKPRYTAAAIAFEGGYAALDGDPPDTKSAVRDVFDALEIVFKLAFPRASRLGASEINQLLKPAIGQLYAGNDGHAARLICSSLGEWVNSAHHYRHSPGTEEPAPPPMGVAVALISSGATFLRWLIETDQAFLNTAPAID